MITALKIILIATLMIILSGCSTSQALRGNEAIEDSALLYNKYATKYLQKCVKQPEPCPALPPPAVIIESKGSDPTTISGVLWSAAKVIVPPVGGWLISEQLD